MIDGFGIVFAIGLLIGVFLVSRRPVNISNVVSPSAVVHAVTSSSGGGARGGGSLIGALFPLILGGILIITVIALVTQVATSAVQSISAPAAVPISAPTSVPTAVPTAAPTAVPTRMPIETPVEVPVYVPVAPDYAPVLVPVGIVGAMVLGFEAFVYFKYIRKTPRGTVQPVRNLSAREVFGVDTSTVKTNKENVGRG